LQTDNNKLLFSAAAVRHCAAVKSAQKQSNSGCLNFALAQSRCNDYDPPDFAVSLKSMNRLVPTLLLSVLIAGCQTAAPQTAPTRLVKETKPAAKPFLSAAARFLQPVLPDRSGNSAQNGTSETTPLLAANPAADVLPVRHSSRPLYQAGSVSPPKEFLTSDSVEKTVQTAASKNRPAAKTVLPVEDAADNTAAPLPDDDDPIAAVKPRHSQSRRLPERKRNIEPEDEDGYETGSEPAEPIVAQTAGKRPPSVLPKETPVYPSLIQLPGAQFPPAAGSGASSGGIVQTSYQTQTPFPAAASASSRGAGDWQPHIRAGIDQLRFQIEQIPNGKTPENEMRLRMLETVLGNRSEAAKPMQTVDQTVNDFMGEHVLGLAALMDDASPNSREKYISAAYRFNESLSHLQNLCPIKFKKVIPVEDWVEFGVYTPRTREYNPGEMFYIYLELENLSVRRVADGFNICTALSYEIRDETANVVAKHDAPVPPELTTQSRKRDYCLHLEGMIPKTLAPGRYYLRIMITDLNDTARQYADEQISLKVAPAMKQTETPH
jgi:hypothetical protein